VGEDLERLVDHCKDTVEVRLRLAAQNAVKESVLAAVVLQEMLNPDKAWDLCDQLEEFVTCFPLLRALCSDLSDATTPVPVTKLFGVALSRRDQEDPLVFVPHRLNVINWKGQFTSLVKGYGDADNIPKNVLFHCSHNNPGFETAVLLDCCSFQGSTKVLICIEARFSDPMATTTLNSEDIKGKLKAMKMATECMGGVPRLLIVIAMRRCTFESSDLPKGENVLVVKRERYLQYLGPTFANRLGLPVEIAVRYQAVSTAAPAAK
jgi:hypothetical protein